MDLSSHPDDRPRRSLGHGPDDEVGGSGLVGQLDHLVGALGVGDDDAVGVLGSEGGDMVEQGQISGSRQTTVLSGCSAPNRDTRWISVATPITEPAGASATPRMM